MSYEIINCYELEIRQDIPAEMELIKSKNKNLKNSNHNFKIILFSIGLGVILFGVFHISKTRKEEKEEY